MKRIVSFFIAFILIFTFSGCEDITGGSSAKSKSASTSKSKPKPKPAKDGKPPEILFENFGFDKYEGYSFEYIEEEKREHLMNLISEEIKKYPDEYYKIVGSYKIYVIKHFGYGAAGLAVNDEKIFINASPLSNKDSKVYYDDAFIRYIFNHEQQHIAEYSLWGGNYSWKEWDKLFNEGIAAGPIDDNPFSDPKGFISSYATKNPKEDRAELMAYWVQYSNNVISQAKKDDLLDKKIVLLFTLLRDRLSFPDPLREYNEKMGR
jgi:hypothetical protein